MFYIITKFNVPSFRMHYFSKATFQLKLIKIRLEFPGVGVGAGGTAFRRPGREMNHSENRRGCASAPGGAGLLATARPSCCGARGRAPHFSSPARPPLCSRVHQLSAWTRGFKLGGGVSRGSGGKRRPVGGSPCSMGGGWLRTARCQTPGAAQLSRSRGTCRPREPGLGQRPMPGSGLRSVLSAARLLACALSEC